MAETDSKRVLLCVSGGIAVYKACDIARALMHAGCEVRVFMTEAAERFVSPLTFEALTGNPVSRSLFEDDETPIPHIELSAWADLILVAPCTANVMAKMAHGLADDLVSSTLLAAASPVLVAPAMNTRMWEHKATRVNYETLLARGIGMVLPQEGLLACGDYGTGKLADVEDIAEASLSALAARKGRPLTGKRVLITAGPTQEAIDPVRFIANASSGKMGYALARAARDAGAQVTLVTGPVSLRRPWNVDSIPVRSASQMRDAATEAFADADIAILAAAVADYRPKEASDHKLKKGVETLESIELVENADILAELSSIAAHDGRFVCGFAAETDDLVPNAQAKLERKGCDMIVANDVSKTESTFGSDTNLVKLVSAEGVEELPLGTKDEVAAAVIAAIAERMS